MSKYYMNELPITWANVTEEANIKREEKTIYILELTDLMKSTIRQANHQIEKAIGNASWLYNLQRAAEDANFDAYMDPRCKTVAEREARVAKKVWEEAEFILNVYEAKYDD